MTEKKDYKISEISNELIEDYGLSKLSKKEKASILKYVQDLIKRLSYNKKYIKGVSPYKLKYVDVQHFKQEPEIIKYFEEKSQKRPDMLSNKTLIKMYFGEIKNKLRSEWKNAGLSEQEGLIIEVDKLHEQKYLRADEMIFLNSNGFSLNGLTMRNSVWRKAKSEFYSVPTLSDSRKKKEVGELLEWYNRSLLIEEEQEKQIEKMFREKKLEIMITAIFNEKFILNEDRLKQDITNYVKGGEHDLIITRCSNKRYTIKSKKTKTKTKNKTKKITGVKTKTKQRVYLPDGELVSFDDDKIENYNIQEVTRSWLRLKDNYSYYKRKLPKDGTELY